MPLSLANRFQAALLGSCLGPMSWMPPLDCSGPGLEPDLAPGPRAAPGGGIALAAAIATLEAGAQQAGLPLASASALDAAPAPPAPDRDRGPSALGQPLQAVLLQLPGLLLAFESCSPEMAGATILTQLLRGAAIAAVSPSPDRESALGLVNDSPPGSRGLYLNPAFPGQSGLDVAALPPPLGQDKAVLRSSSPDDLPASQAVASLALELTPSHWDLLGGRLRAIAQGQDLAPATAIAAASWLGIWFGAAHGVAALPWRPQVHWGPARSQLLSLGDHLHRRWSGQTDPQKVGVS